MRRVHSHSIKKMEEPSTTEQHVELELPESDGNHESMFDDADLVKTLKMS